LDAKEPATPNIPSGKTFNCLWITIFIAQARTAKSVPIKKGSCLEVKAIIASYKVSYREHNAHCMAPIIVDRAMQEWATVRGIDTYF